jgi:hypothetical protein
MTSLPKIDTRARIHDLNAVILESEWLRIAVLPDIGAKIYDLVSKPTGRNFLWHNPRIAPHIYPIEANFDNHWCGGWDEAFPTCDECDYGGEHYPNLGELRSVRWTVESARTDGDTASLTLSAFGPISPVRAVKEVALAADSPSLKVVYELENLGPLPMDFIWGTHPALDPTPHMTLRIPARTGIVGQASHPSLGTAGQHYTWPIVETPAGRTDMSKVQSIEAKVCCGHYATELEAGWYAAEDLQTGEGFLLQFPVERCPYLWMWLVYGGWRGYHHVIVEPWTSYPVNLAQAQAGGGARRLEPGEKFQVEVCATIYVKPDTWQDVLRRPGVSYQERARPKGEERSGPGSFNRVSWL